MNTDNHVFNLDKTLHELKHYLPSQKTLKDFIHHNSLHPFQNERFYDGIFRASKIFGYKATLQLQDYRTLFKLNRIKEHVIDRIIINRKGSDALEEWVEKVLINEYDENIEPRINKFRSDWKRVYKLDLDSLVHPLLYRILCSYLDQGISLWQFPIHPNGFLASIRELESNSHVSFFKTKKVQSLLQDASITMLDLLQVIVGDEHYYEQYLFDLCFSHRGWSGIIGVIEDNPGTLLIDKIISLQDMIHVELLMEYDTLLDQLGDSWKPLSHTAQQPPIDLFSPVESSELEEVLKIWQDSFEWSYYDEVINGIKTNSTRQKTHAKNISFQAIFCIDERECSLRRHIEYIADDCETFGAPGFFGVEFYFKPIGAKFKDKLCPAPVYPRYLIKEYDAHDHHQQDIMFNKSIFTLVHGFIITIGLGLSSIWKLLQIIFMPKMSPSISDAFSHMNKYSKLTVVNQSTHDIEDGLQIGFTIQEMSDRVYNFLKGIGLIQSFSPLIYIIAHGSSSANNPHHGAHDCGACSGRPGCVNARVFSIMANHPEVRHLLKMKGIDIPDSTVFIPAMHDTASDVIEYYDDNNVDEHINQKHKIIKQQFEQALDLNAKERSRRFASINTLQDIHKIRKAIEQRSVSMFEPRPELGHGTNSLAIIGRRNITKGLYLDRRAFLNSYDYRTDLDGTFLANVMAPIGVVCGGINLEYYFSRVDNVKLGCGTKLPHNVMGLIGVANSIDGDLRPGLPWQMIEPHDPVRLLVIVEHFPEIVLKTIQSNAAMYEWYKNEWIHIVAMHPETQEFFYFSKEHFRHYHVQPLAIKSIDNVHHLFEEAPEMITNHIKHATFENLPIYQIESNISC